MQRIIRQLIQSLMITVLTVIALVCSAYAANLDATVPASLPITVSSNSTVTTATNAAIHNYGTSPIIVSSINVTAENGWSLATKDTAASASIGNKVISMGFNDSWMDASGAVDTSGFGRIAPSDTLNLFYDAKVPGVVTTESTATVAAAIFVVGVPPAPTMAAGSSWYKSSQNRSTITKITFMDSYTSTTTADETWNADADNIGDIKCYRMGTEIIITGNGAGKIHTNADSRYMFSDPTYKSKFSELTSIENLPLLDTTNVTDMSGMFYSCSKLTSIDLSHLDTTNVTSMSSMFQHCSDLTSLDLSLFDTSNVTNMAGMFESCSGLTSLDLSSFDTSNVTDMGYMFENCSGLTSLDLSLFDTSNVTYMSFMFYSCRALNTVYASDKWNTDKVINSGNMFCACSNLKGVISYDPYKISAEYANWTTGYFTYKALPATLAAGSDWYKSSEDRNNITKITFMDSYTPASYDEKWAADVNGTGDITCYRTGTEIIIAGNGAGKIKANVDSSYLFSYSSYDKCFEVLASIENLTLLDTANVTDMRYMFYYCKRLTSLDVSHFDTSNVTDMRYMFNGCSGLTSLGISNFDTSKVTSMKSMFSNCSGLTSLDLSNFNTTKVTYMDSMFNGCSGLTSLNLSNFNTSNVTNMSNMFSYCRGLTSLDLSNFDTSNVTSMFYMFTDCRGLKSLDLSNFNTGNVMNMRYMFFRCSGLTSLNLSNFNTAKVINMNGMFYSCSNLTTIYASDNWNTDKVTNSSGMFSNCIVLKGDIAFNSAYTDKTYAKTSDGYLTYKAAPSKTLSLNIDPNSGAVTSYDVSTAPISRFRSITDWSDTTNVA